MRERVSECVNREVGAKSKSRELAVLYFFHSSLANGVCC